MAYGALSEASSSPTVSFGGPSAMSFIRATSSSWSSWGRVARTAARTSSHGEERFSRALRSSSIPTRWSFSSFQAASGAVVAPNSSTTGRKSGSSSPTASGAASSTPCWR